MMPCVAWLEQHLHPTGLVCPRCQSTECQLFRRHDHFPTYRCRACQRSDTILTGTVFDKTRQRPATIVLLLRGIAKGESTAVNKKMAWPSRMRSLFVSVVSLPARTTRVRFSQREIGANGIASAGGCRVAGVAAGSLCLCRGPIGEPRY